MAPARYIIPAATALKPLSQGDLSGLCGFYSILNAIQVVLYPQRLTRKQLQDLYLHGVAHLSRTRRLKSILGAGMDETTWLRLATALTGHVNDRYGRSLVFKQILTGTARSRGRALHRIRTTISAGNPVLVGLGGALCHYTVLVGFTEQRLQFFDSSGFKWIAAAGVGIGEGSGRPHRLFADSVSGLFDEW